MNTINKFIFIIGIILVCCSSFAQNKEDNPSLAVLVYCDGENQELADKLQPLVEAELSLQWDGTLVEREKIDELLDEMKLTRSGLSEPDTQLKFGKMITMDCLLTVRVNKDSVKTTFSQFPSTTIIHEKEYTERLEPQSLSVNIVTNAIKAYREHNRDPLKPQVSIGSFFNAGPFKQYFDFSKNISIQLRQELVKDNSIVVTERLLPSDLLGEFELARSGITESIAKNLSAPSSDILLYGEFKAKPEQDLTNPAAELDFTLFIISPTGLCDKKQVEFSCYSNEPEIPAEKAIQLIEQALKEVKTKLASGQKRIFSQKEYEEFKRQAFQLMPKPPGKDGNYANENQPDYSGMTQNGTIDELEHAFLMLECAMLFNGNDTQILVCTGAILNKLSELKSNNLSPSESEKGQLLKTSLDFIERAYLTASNWNTRAAYINFLVFRNQAKDTPPYSLKAAEYVLKTRETESWTIFQIAYAIERALSENGDTEQLCQFFSNPANKHIGIDEKMILFFTLFNTAKFQLYKNKDNFTTSQTLLECAQSLMKESDDYISWIGHNLYLLTCCYMGGDIPVEYAKYFRSTISLVEKIQKYGTDLLMLQHIEFKLFFDTYDRVIKQYDLDDDSVELKERYIIKMRKESAYYDIVSNNIFNALRNQLWEEGEYETGYKLFSKLINNVRSPSDFYIKERDKFFNAMNDIIQTNSIKEINSNILEDIGTKLYRRVPNKFIPLEDCLWVIITNSFYKINHKEKNITFIQNIPRGSLQYSVAQNYIGISTQSNCLYLLNTENMEIQNFTPDNSSFQGRNIKAICESENNFLIWVYDRNPPFDYITYLLEPETAKISLIDEIKLPRMDELDRKLKLKKLIRTRSYPDLAISDSEGNQLIQYPKTKFANINDIEIWQDQLVFATDSSLILFEPDSGITRELIRKENLKFICLCEFENELYIGTSEGLYCVCPEIFNEIVKQADK